MTPETTDMSQLAAHVTDICDTYMQGRPYDRFEYAHEAAALWSSVLEDTFELGRRLVVMKEAEPHGEYQRLVEEVVGVPSQTARKIVQATAKFMSPRLAKKTPKLLGLGKTKLYELMVEDDDELAALAEGGTVAGLALDDIERMSTRELRVQLREARADADAKDAVIADKNQRLDIQATEVKRIKATPPDEVSKQIRRDAAGICFEAEAKIRDGVYQAIRTLQEHARAHHIDVEQWCTGQINQLDSALLEVAGELGIGINRTTSAPEWETMGQQPVREVN